MSRAVGCGAEACWRGGEVECVFMSLFAFFWSNVLGGSLSAFRADFFGYGIFRYGTAPVVGSGKMGVVYIARPGLYIQQAVPAGQRSR